MKPAVLFLLLVSLVYTGDAFGNARHACQPPYQPTNTLKVLLNYSPTMDYISKAPDECAEPFAEKVKTLVASTWMLSQGCIDVTLEDIEKAKSARKSQSPRSSPDEEEKS